MLGQQPSTTDDRHGKDGDAITRIPAQTGGSARARSDSEAAVKSDDAQADSI